MTDDQRDTEKIERPEIAGEPRGREAAAAARQARTGGGPRVLGFLVQSFLGTVLGMLVVLVVVLGVLWAFKDEIASALNPFGTETIDRSDPPVLLSIQDLARFVAAEGNYEVVVDLEKDTKYVPDWLSGERILYVANGSVEAYVDFRDLTEENIHVSDDGTAVEIVLPAPVLAEPRVDLERSRPISEDRGLINRVNDLFAGDTDSRQETLLLAQEKMADAADASDLGSRARENTTKTLNAMLLPLGFEKVTVTFEGGPAPGK